MIKRLLLPFLLLFFARAFSQQYYPLISDSARWHVFWTSGVGGFTDIFKTKEDTLIGNYAYKRIEYTQASILSQVFLREDTAARQVWYYNADSSSEKILYDFSLQQGDSIYLEFVTQWWGPFMLTGWYVVDSIRSTTILAGTRNKFFLHNRNNPLVWFNNQTQAISPPLVWVEGVGALIHPFYPLYGWLSSYTWFSNCTDYSGDVTCAFQDGSKQYHNACYDNYMTPQYMTYIQDSCTWLIGDGIREMSNNLFDVNISPNPSHGNLTLSFTARHAVNGVISIRDLLGQSVETYYSGKMAEGKHSYNLDPDLPQGIYFLQVESAEGMVSKKLVIVK